MAPTKKTRGKAAKASPAGTPKPAKPRPAAKRKAAAPKDPLQAAKRRLRGFALALPESTEEFPWGEAVYKVRGKVFVFTAADDEVFSLAVKLPRTGDFALDREFVEPTGYGLGRSGWVTATFQRGDDIPFDYLEAWVRESYLAVAPKRLAQSLV